MLSELHNPVYDVLAITRRLEKTFDGVTHAEVHLLAYVGCLLSVYRRAPATDWGYGFIRSQWGAPFSRDIENAIKVLTNGAFLHGGNDLLRLTDRGCDFATFLDRGVEHRWRTPYLTGACGSALAMPVGSIRSALRLEPSLRRASVHSQPRPLLDLQQDAELYEQFGAVNAVVGANVTDLMVPSVVWLTYLESIQRAQVREAVVAAEAIEHHR